VREDQRESHWHFTTQKFEVIHFSCRHSGRRLIKHCHFARNDPNHQCFGAWSVKREWINANQVCHACGQQGVVRRTTEQQQQQPGQIRL
jgi:hypothetical protein